jgi:hypothetical protein
MTQAQLANSPLNGKRSGLRGQWVKWARVDHLAIRQADLREAAPTAHAVRKAEDKTACGLKLDGAVVLPARHARQFGQKCERCESARAFAEVR